MGGIIMAWVAVDSLNRELIFKNKPIRDIDTDYMITYHGWFDRTNNNWGIELPKGSIKKLISRELTWEDEELVELKEEIIMAEWKISEIKKIDDEWYQCICSSDCRQCDLKNKTSIYCEKYPCVTLKREDGNEVIFKKLRKIGEPYYIGKKLFQRYEVFTKPYIFNYSYFTVKTLDDNYISIEIKMETRKIIMSEDDKNYLLSTLENILSNYKENKDEIIDTLRKHITTVANIDTDRLKPFDLEAAKEGKSVCTRSGKKAKILCFDLSEEYPIAARIYDDSDANKILLFSYKEDGRINDFDYEFDLMMLPEKECE